MACKYCIEAPEQGKCVRDGCRTCCECDRDIATENKTEEAVRALCALSSGDRAYGLSNNNGSWTIVIVAKGGSSEPLTVRLPAVIREARCVSLEDFVQVEKADPISVADVQSAAAAKSART